MKYATEKKKILLAQLQKSMKSDTVKTKKQHKKCDNTLK